MEKLIEKTYLSYCSVSISFTYSFVAKMTQNGDLPKIDYNFKEFSRKLVDKENNGWQFGTPENRMGVTPLTTIFQNIKDKEKENDPDKFRELLIYKDITPESLSTKGVALDFKDTDDKSVNLKCDIEAYIRVFFNGSGCITFTISYKKEDLNWKIIKIILALSNRSFDNKKYSKMNDKFIYKYFIEAMERFKNDCDCELYCQSLVNVDITKTENFNRPNGVSPQNPNINIVLEIDEAEKFWESNSLSQNKEIANLLLNIVPEEFNSDKNKKQIDRVRIPKDLRDDNGLLENLSWDNRLFISIYRQISIIVQTKNDKPEIPFIQRSLLDVVELLHTRWYFSIIMNALLDEEIDKISGQASDTNIDMLKDLITKRKLFAYFLHNPIPYRFWGGSVTDVIEFAEKNMWLDKLKEMTYRKFQIIDQLYEDQMQYIKLDTYRNIYEDKDYKKNLELSKNRLDSIRNKLKGM